MDESLNSVLIGGTPIYVLLIVAAVVWAIRRPRQLEETESFRIVYPLLLGIAWQCVHFVEEFTTGFQVRFPALLNLASYPDAIFVTFNLVWMALWILSAIGILHNVRAAYFPVWFFAIAMLVNGVAHPLLALVVGGYFPGLVSSPLAGIAGYVLLTRLIEFTDVAE